MVADCVFITVCNLGTNSDVQFDVLLLCRFKVAIAPDNAPDNAPDVGLEQGAYWPMCSPTKLLSYIDMICDLKLFTDVAAIIFLLSLFHGFITRWL